MNAKRKRLPDAMRRVTQIVHQHLLYDQRHPENLPIIAERLGVTPLCALAVAVADQVCEEFVLVAR